MANKIISCVQYHKTQAIKFTERERLSSQNNKTSDTQD